MNLFWDSDPIIKRIVNDSLKNDGWKKFSKTTFEIHETFFSDILDQIYSIKDNNPNIELLINTYKTNPRKSLKVDWIGRKDDTILALEIKSRLLALPKVNSKNDENNNFIKYHFSSPIVAWHSLFEIKKQKLDTLNLDELVESLEFLKYYYVADQLYKDDLKFVLGVIVPFYSRPEKVEALETSLNDIRDFRVSYNHKFYDTIIIQFYLDEKVSKNLLYPKNIFFKVIWQSNPDFLIPKLKDVNFSMLAQTIHYSFSGCLNCKYTHHCEKF